MSLFLPFAKMDNVVLQIHSDYPMEMLTARIQTFISKMNLEIALSLNLHLKPFMAMSHLLIRMLWFMMAGMDNGLN